MIGVNFQPGGGGGTSAKPAGSNQGVQEAIKVLSLRLPKVVGAQGITSQGLMDSPGSGGNPRVDSVVNSILAKMFPTSQPQQPAQSFGMAPSSDAPANAPSFSGSSAPAYAKPKQTPFDFSDFILSPDGTPRVFFDAPWGHGDLSVGQDGRPMGAHDSILGAPGGKPSQGLDGSAFPPATIAPTPNFNFPWSSYEAPQKESTYEI